MENGEKEQLCFINPVLESKDVSTALSLVFSELREDICLKPKAFFGKFDSSLGASDLLALVDEKFTGVCAGVVSSVFWNKKIMKFDEEDPVCVDDIRIIVYELFRDFLLFSKREREDGSNYFYSHCIGTTRGGLDMLRLSGKASVLALNKHDNIEDGPKIYSGYTQNDLMDPDLYLDRLDGDVGEEELIILVDTVDRLVRGVTKFRETDDNLVRFDSEMFHSADEATYYQLYTTAEGDLRVLYTKLPDRTHNMSTISGKSPDKQRSVSLQTERDYVQLARVLEVKDCTRKLVNCCCGVLNPLLLDSFRNLSSERVRKTLENPMRKVFSDNKLFDSEIIRRVDVRPLELDEFISNIGRPISDISMRDLKISDLNPMCEIVATLAREEDVPFVAREVPSLLRMQQHKTFEGSRESVPGRAFSDQLVKDGKTFVYNGIIIDGFSRDCGGHVTVRVIDERNAYLAQRGVLAYHHSDKQPKNIVSAITSIVAEKRRRKRDVDFIELANEKLLCPKTYFSTPNGDVVELPLGSTYLDAANAVHEKFVIGMQEVHFYDSLVDRTYEEKDPFDLLPAVSVDDDKPVISFVSCLSTKGEYDPSKVDVDPCWMLFCKNEGTKDTIRRYLKKLSDEEALAIGKSFIERINSIYWIGKLIGDAGNISNEFFVKIGHGDISVFDKIINSVPSAKSFMVEAKIPNQTGVLMQLLPYFKNVGLSVRPGNHEKKDGYDLFTFEVVYPESGKDIDFGELLKILLRISYIYSIKIIG